MPPTIVKCPTHYNFRAETGTMDTLKVNYHITISAYSRQEAMEKAQELENKLGIELRLGVAFPK